VLRRLVERHAPLLVAAPLLLGLFQFLICAAVASANVGGAIQLLLSTLPPILQNAVSSQLLGGLTIPGLIAFGWSHPIAQALGAAVAIVLAAGAIAGEVEAGTIELVLSQPISRWRYFEAQLLFAGIALVVVSAAGIAGTVIGQRVFSLPPFGTAGLLKLGANLLALDAAIFGITLLVSAFSREGGRVATVGFLIALTSYLAQVIGSLWEPAAFVLPFTLHHYFSPRDLLVAGTSPARPVAVLVGVMAAGVAAGWGRFRRRDLP
jgi:ABC-2 type transport system permease protein